MLRRRKKKKKKKKRHITDVILLNRVLLYSVICGLWRKTEGGTEKSEPKENTILYDYHGLYCYVELVLSFKKCKWEDEERSLNSLPVAVHTLVGGEEAKDSTG